VILSDLHVSCIYGHCDVHSDSDSSRASTTDPMSTHDNMSGFTEHHVRSNWPGKKSIISTKLSNYSSLLDMSVEKTAIA
jgi:hypothetical protein